jgi:NSS family neurotransmitter:Na+ symporter
MASTRGEFSSRFGFVMAAAGSAVGLGNIWGFPTQAASNGGAAFLLVYLILAFTLAYPALMAELIIGRHAHANAVNALRLISTGPATHKIGTTVGVIGFIVAGMILSFYAIVAGWMISFCLASLAEFFGMQAVADWLTSFGMTRNLFFMLIFLVLTVGIISEGVREGIERWSARLMPLLLVSLILLVLYVCTLDGAMEGLKVYLLPDFERALSPKLIIAALGSAFFSLSLGVGTMLIYGSYISHHRGYHDCGDRRLPGTSRHVRGPAQRRGNFYRQRRLDLRGHPYFHRPPGIVCDHGPGGNRGVLHLFLSNELTSSISMLEVPVAYTIEEHGLSRKTAVYGIGCAIAVFSATILVNFETLFGLVIAFTTRYSQPILGFMFCVYAGWVWQRDKVLKEVQKGSPQVEHTLFWKIWPWYVKLVCPVVILAIFAQSLWGG